MQINSYESLLEAREIFQNFSGTARPEQPGSFKFTSGSDQVCISSAAQSAYAASKADHENHDHSDQSKAVDAFRDYMDKTRGKVDHPAGGDIEALKARLEELQNKLAQIASCTTTPEETKGSMINAVQAEIAQIVAQIAELVAQAASSENKK
ncbi:FlxA-like family protein [Desulfonatronovibrio hydrogenovorans]|uniref:FlxA-like family protein n=1 Tax=Desulfonatronovibrio hydrogenovorans TaxID=53245 RepID=UPI00048F63D1|nr:FlxA-like family protein [Desulfonatronovibrio hydrogenovorans]